MQCFQNDIVVFQACGLLFLLLTHILRGLHSITDARVSHGSLCLCFPFLEQSLQSWHLGVGPFRFLVVGDTSYLYLPACASLLGITTCSLLLAHVHPMRVSPSWAHPTSPFSPSGPGDLFQWAYDPGQTSSKSTQLQYFCWAGGPAAMGSPPCVATCASGRPERQQEEARP